MQSKNSNETPISVLRNRMSPICNYFAMLRILEDSKISDTYRIDLQILLEQELKQCQTELTEIVKLLKNDDNWNHG